MASFPYPWEKEFREDGWYVIATETPERRAIGPFDLATASLIASVHALAEAVRSLLTASTPTRVRRARQLAKQALDQAEGR